MRIRPATPADAEAIERIRVRGWQAAYRHVFPAEQLDRMPADSSRFVEALRDPPRGQACLVAETDRIVGWATIQPAGDGGGELRGIYVDPDAWGAGVGRALLARAEEELARSFDAALLWVLDDNPRARRFYEAAGWRFDGTRSTLERLGVRARIVRYRKLLRSSTSRS
jgi:ribosomal protein S18 acetylase RimI-like enzyme